MTRVVAWGSPVVAAGAAAMLGGGAGGDSTIFVAAGRTLLSTHWSEAFANKGIQAGPLQLALFGSVGRSATALAVVLALTTMLLLLAAAETIGVKSPVLLGALGFLAVGLGFTRMSYEYGHPADAMLPLIWVLAAVSARRSRTVRAGLLVGLSAGLETWGILGVAVLALAPRWRDAGRGALAAAAVPALLFLPFVLSGHFAMGAYQWQVHPPALLSYLVPEGAPFGWQLRLVQAAFAVCAGIAAARLMRGSPHVPWVVPLAVVAARLLLDPLLLPYYPAAVWGPALVSVTLLASRVALRRQRESFA